MIVGFDIVSEMISHKICSPIDNDSNFCGTLKIIVISSIKYPSEGHEYGKYESRTLAWFSDLHEIKWHPMNVKNFVPGQQGNKLTIFKNAFYFYIQNMNLVFRSFDILQRLDLLFPT